MRANAVFGSGRLPIRGYREQAVYLKSLTMKGFKSFADATTLDLEPGVTVVVGPNGSGKSNVVDAVAWVLGAQGPRVVRSTKMDDVIFAGTEGPNRRSPLGRAEVSLVIDNSSRRLPIDFSEVTISRTLFRTGESEYAINHVPCRLLDVQELLSDSGVGRQQHVIIGQGQLSSILESRPEERRMVIEEAAGILKYRRRRERAGVAEREVREAWQSRLEAVHDVELPGDVLVAFGGPPHGIAGLRTMVGAGNRALTCSALKPQGLPPEGLAAIAAQMARGGLDFIKDDHGIADQAYSPFAARVPVIAEAVAKTGARTVYLPSLSGHLEQMRRQITIVRAAGLKGVLIAPMIAGLATFHQLVKDNPDIAFMGHPAMAGSGQIAPPLLFGKLFRLLGADAVVFANHGGRFGYTPATCQALAQTALASWGGLKPSIPVPAGGMTLARVPENENFRRSTRSACPESVPSNSVSTTPLPTGAREGERKPSPPTVAWRAPAARTRVRPVSALKVPPPVAPIAGRAVNGANGAMSDSLIEADHLPSIPPLRDGAASRLAIRRPPRLRAIE
jgi:energy-coupling factor transporter ATP-binding protein EcfA2